MTSKTTISPALECEHGTDFSDFFICYSVATLTTSDGTKYDITCDGFTLVLNEREGNGESRVTLRPLFEEMLKQLKAPQERV